MTQAQKFIFAKRFEGMPKVDDFVLEEETLPDLEDGEILIEALYWSVDPYMRPFSEQLRLGITMIGGQIAKVIESKNEDFPEESIIYAAVGSRTHTVFNPNDEQDPVNKAYILPPLGDLSPSLCLGNLGMTGLSGYFGFTDICDPKEGDVVVISSAAGAVGSLVDQVAKMRGCKVIGIAGTDEKCEWLTGELEFDHAINYKTETVDEKLNEYAPDGVDCYFDNVGGELFNTIFSKLRENGRIAVCGAISVYNTPFFEWPTNPILLPVFTLKQLTMRGFNVKRYLDRFGEGIIQLIQWTDEGSIKSRETVTEGFENLPQAFIELLEGQCFGKAVVKA